MITISPGHYGIGTGAVGFIDEVAEARKVSLQVCKLLVERGIHVHHIVDNRSKNQRQNLMYLVQQHNRTNRMLDVSIHFNAIAGKVERGIGVEVLYVNKALANFANTMSAAIAKASHLKDRGGKYRANLAFLNGTNKPCIIIEVCFVNSVTDVQLYKKHFSEVCTVISEQLTNYIKLN